MFLCVFDAEVCSSKQNAKNQRPATVESIPAASKKDGLLFQAVPW